MLIHARGTFVAAVALTLGCSGCDGSPAAPAAQTIDVFALANTFSPFSATVAASGVVRYNIFGDDHNVIFSHAVAGYPADINIVKDTIVARTFPTKGTFSYTCTIHTGMNGEIIVQ